MNHLLKNIQKEESSSKKNEEDDKRLATYYIFTLNTYDYIKETSN